MAAVDDACPCARENQEDAMSARLEHANLHVKDLYAVLRFVQTAFPEFRVRGQGTSWTGARWIHVGSDESYLALYQASHEPAEPWEPYGGKPGLNHLGFEVDDAEGLRKRLAEGGYRESTVPNAHPHRRRVYFYDPDGNDWEFVQYLTGDPALRNDYAIPD
jgi:catechol 2,3-dioxygenase-like lactoylglutathione lyase family enzyme